MENKEKLPWDLVGEILSRVPPTCLLRFKTVCKQWKALFNDKTFINNHKMTFRFVLLSSGKIYSVSVNPKVEVRELTLNTPDLKSKVPQSLIATNGFLLCAKDKRAVVWNPWLRQIRYIHPELNNPRLKFLAICYDNNRRVDDEIVYKTLSISRKGFFFEETTYATLLPSPSSSPIPREEMVRYNFTSVVSLNGTFENFSKFCDLPCGKNHLRDALVLGVFREDRLSLFKQCYVTKKIEVWVTKNKVDDRYGMDVKWTSFMEVSVHTIPDLVKTEPYLQSQPSYFIDGKRLVICSCDETGQAWIYVVGENRLISKTKLDSMVECWPRHCTYFPSLVLIPGGKSEDA
ncbi:hypothetical protein CARUB_v10012288mg [Capsella rubella]|uniref:F-box domain-containing protein n=1 Tax=Capsella rubella TaxID=81985 RepID=R0IA19_9BRAS|nr:hypothetical protein CARUB_v10012288mg [Capsella rubella]